jgi:protein-S-isoprenylcysteine O-methyltransferase Ste14
MLALRLYLLAGLALHKIVWEVLKRGGSPGRGPLLIRAGKVAVLAGIAIQTLLPDVLPICGEPAVLRAAGTAIFTLGLATAVAARIQLGDNWSDIEAARVAAHQSVVVRGPYALIRHPIYTADLTLLLGLELALNSWLVAGVAVVAPIVLRKAIREEQMLVHNLPGYSDYCRRTKRFIPFIV